MDTITTLTVKAVEVLVRAYGFDGLLRLGKGRPDADERISKLAKIHEDLEAALAAVSELQTNAKAKQEEAAGLQQMVAQLQEDKKAAEELVKVPEEAFARMVQRASASGRGRGLLEGIAIGFLTGLASSLVAWYITTPAAPK